MNLTLTAERTTHAENTAFHTKPFGVTMGSAPAPMLVALWSCDGEGRLAQTWVNVSVAAAVDLRHRR